MIWQKICDFCDSGHFYEAVKEVLIAISKSTHFDIGFMGKCDIYAVDSADGMVKKFYNWRERNEKKSNGNFDDGFIDNGIKRMRKEM